MDTTYDTLIEYVGNSANKKHFRVRNSVKRINEHIGGLRITASKFRGTSLGSYCNQEANRLQKNLDKALEIN